MFLNPKINDTGIAFSKTIYFNIAPYNLCKKHYNNICISIQLAAKVKNLPQVLP